MKTAKSEHDDWADDAARNTDRWKLHILESALRLGDLGYHIMPLRRLSKASISGHLCHNQATNSKATIARWFGPGGDFAGHNIGIAGGGKGGVVIIDLDSSKMTNGKLKDGIAEMQKLEANGKFKFPRDMTSATPSGGAHIFCAWVPWIANGQDVLAPGIDVRTGPPDSMSGHVVAPPSVVGSRQYQWDNGPIAVSLLKEPPNTTAARPKLSVLRNEKPQWAGTGVGSENVESGDMLSGIAERDIDEMLALIPPDEMSYEEWLRVGMALKATIGDFGLEKWTQWSEADSDRYQPGECKRKWEAFKGGTTIGSLIHQAQKHGYKAPPSTDVGMALDRINRETPGIIAKGKERWALMNDHDGLALMAKSAAMLYHATNRVKIDGKMVNPINLWEPWHGRKLYHRIAMHPPGGPECPPDTYNMWRGLAVDPIEGDVTPWVEFMDIIVHEKDALAWLHDWIALMFQKPGLRPQSAIVMRGDEGIGKNTITDILGSLVKPFNFFQIEDTHHAMSNFNSFRANNLLLVLNEAVWSGNHRHSSILKGMVTEPTVSVEMKGVDRFSAPNNSHVFVFTNEEWAVPVSESGRRYCILNLERTLKGKYAYWDNLRAWAETKEAKSAILHWYINKEITHDLKSVPSTKATAQQKRLTALAESRHATVNHALNAVIYLAGIGESVEHSDSRGVIRLFSTKQLKEAWQAVTGERALDSVPKRIRDQLFAMDCGDGTVVRYWRNGKARRGVQVPNSLDEFASTVERMSKLDIGELERPDIWLDRDE